MLNIVVPYYTMDRITTKILNKPLTWLLSVFIEGGQYFNKLQKKKNINEDDVTGMRKRDLSTVFETV